jgi:HEAT repeat protein
MSVPATPACAVVRAFAVQELVAQLQDLHAGPQALPQIIALGADAVAPLEAFLRGPSQSLHQQRTLAADALAAIGGEASTAALTRALRDCAARTPDPLSQQAEDVVASRIAEHLALRPAPAVFEALLDALSIRPLPAYARALGQLADARAIPALALCLYEDAARPAAAQALRRFGAAAAPALRTLLATPRQVRTLEPPVCIAGRAAAAMLLGELGQIQPLIAALSDRERAVRVAAALGLVHRREQDLRRMALAVLVSALDDPGWAAAHEVLQALSGCSELLTAPVLGLLTRAAADDPGQRRRRRAATLAGQLHLAAAVVPLAALSTQADARLRLAAVDALARIPATTDDQLARFLADSDTVVARHALAALTTRAARAGHPVGAPQISRWLRLGGQSRWHRWRHTWPLLLAAARMRRTAGRHEQI